MTLVVTHNEKTGAAEAGRGVRFERIRRILR